MVTGGARDSAREWARRLLRAPALLTGLLYLAIAIGGAYSVFHHYDLERPKGLNDPVEYVNIYRGNILDTRVRYRILVPALAKLVPVDHLTWLGEALGAHKEQLAFLVVNMSMGLWAVGFLHGAGRRLGFGWAETVLGGALFLTASPVVVALGTPLVDAATFLCASAVEWGVIAESTTAISLAILAGVFARDVTVIVVVVPLLARRPKLWPIATAFVMAVGSWLLLKHHLDAEHPYLTDESTISTQTKMYLTAHPLPRLGDMRDFAQTYLGPGCLVWFGWRDRATLPAYIRATIPWIGFCTLLGLFMGNAARVSFVGFPALFPFMLLGITRLMRAHGEPRAQIAPSNP